MILNGHPMTHTPLLDPSKPQAMLLACPAYRESPMQVVVVDGCAITVKDETDRMGLGAFKALGGVYAVAQIIAARLNGDLSPEAFLDAPFRTTASGMTFVCASAGNHGMAVAAGAQLFGAKARIHLAETVPESFAARLRAKGAEVVRSGPDYEASIAAAIADADTTGAIHLADGSWPGYTEPPRLVMEGYTIIAEEMRQSFEASNAWPSDVYLQAGVGGLAAAIADRIRRSWAKQPRIIVVEPEAAPCLRDSARAGHMVTVEGPVSSMGRLDCKTPSMLAFDILRDAADAWMTVSEDSAANAVKAAARAGYVTTPSGVAGLAACLADPDAAGAAPLVILSEGGLGD